MSGSSHGSTRHWGLCQCLVCGASWIPRKLGRPARCPACKSEYWDRPGARLKQRTPKRLRIEREKEEEK